MVVHICEAVMALRCYVQCLAFVAITAASPAFAALPPAYQRAAELKAVTDVATKALDGDPIVGVEYILEDVYRAYSANCVVTVLLNTIQDEGNEPMVGPRRFEAIADTPVCED